MAGWRITDRTRALALRCLRLQRAIVREQYGLRTGGLRGYGLDAALSPALKRWERALRAEAARLGIDADPAPAEPTRAPTPRERPGIVRD